MMYYQLWHEQTHAFSATRWLREWVKPVAAALRKEELPVFAIPGL